MAKPSPTEAAVKPSPTEAIVKVFAKHSHVRLTDLAPAAGAKDAKTIRPILMDELAELVGMSGGQELRRGSVPEDDPSKRPRGWPNWNPRWRAASGSAQPAAGVISTGTPLSCLWVAGGLFQSRWNHSRQWAYQQIRSRSKS